MQAETYIIISIPDLGGIPSVRAFDSFDMALEMFDAMKADVIETCGADYVLDDALNQLIMETGAELYLHTVPVE